MQLLGSDIIPNTVSKSPWLFESKSYEGPMKGGRRRHRKAKTNRRNRSVKNKTRRRKYK